MSYILGKLTQAFLALFGVASLVFFLFTVLPGNPAQMMLDQNEDSKQIEAIKRRGKYILVFFENSKVLIIHLGMSGKIILNDLNEKENKHSHVIFTLNSGKKFMFNDPRRFGMVILSEKNKYLYQSRFKNMGPEPLNPEFNYQSLLFC